jgi:hypothetical protein
MAKGEHAGQLETSEDTSFPFSILSTLFLQVRELKIPEIQPPFGTYVVIWNGIASGSGLFVQRSPCGDVFHPKVLSFWKCF